MKTVNEIVRDTLNQIRGAYRDGEENGEKRGLEKGRAEGRAKESKPNAGKASA